MCTKASRHHKQQEASFDHKVGNRLSNWPWKSLKKSEISCRYPENERKHSYGVFCLIVSHCHTNVVLKFLVWPQKHQSFKKYHQREWQTHICGLNGCLCMSVCICSQYNDTSLFIISLMVIFVDVPLVSNEYQTKT